MVIRFILAWVLRSTWWLFEALVKIFTSFRFMSICGLRVEVGEDKRLVMFLIRFFGFVSFRGSGKVTILGCV